MAVCLTVVHLKYFWNQPLLFPIPWLCAPACSFKGFLPSVYMCVTRKWLQQTKPQVFSLSLSLTLTYLPLSFLSFWRSERLCYLTVSVIRCSAAANRQIERKHLTIVMDVSMNSFWWWVKWWRLMWWECVCVSVICHSCLQSLESGLSKWSLCEETKQLMMLVLIQSCGCGAGSPWFRKGSFIIPGVTVLLA